MKVSELIYNLLGFVTTDQSTNCFKVIKTNQRQSLTYRQSNSLKSLLVKETGPDIVCLQTSQCLVGCYSLIAETESTLFPVDSGDGGDRWEKTEPGPGGQQPGGLCAGPQTNTFTGVQHPQPGLLLHHHLPGQHHRGRPAHHLG